MTRTTTGDRLVDEILAMLAEGPNRQTKPDYSRASTMAWDQMHLRAKWEDTDLARHATERERKRSPLAGYRVLIDDNFHFMDEEDRYEHGVFGTADEAVTACKRVVDRCLKSMLKPDTTAAALYDQYVSFGEDPYVVAVDRTDAWVTFSAWDYAKEQCEVLARPGAVREITARQRAHLAAAALLDLPVIDAPPIAP
jgi:hypothetical protein